MRRWQTVLIVTALLLVTLLIAVNWLTGLITAAPQVDFASLADIHPAIRVQVNTAPIEEELLEQIRASGRLMAPEFVVRSVLPHGFSLWLAPNFDREMIELRALIQEKRGGPLMARILNGEGSYAEIEQFAFDVEGIRAPRRGAMTLNGWFPVERNAGRQLREDFNANPTPALREMDGSHLLEIRADNSNGAAYIVFASLLNAFDIRLDEQEEKISLTSFQFVDELAVTADVVMDDSIGIVCEMDIEPGQKNKMAVVNLKIGLDELSERLGQQWQREHGLTLTGQSEWHGDTLVFTYRLDDVPALLEAFRPSEPRPRPDLE